MVSSCPLGAVSHVSGESHQQLGKGQGSRLTQGQDGTEEPLSSSPQPVSVQGGAGMSSSEIRGPQQREGEEREPPAGGRDQGEWR